MQDLNNSIYSVSSLNEAIKSTLENNVLLKYIFLKGEISNFKAHFSGILYFTLKDEKSTISAIMFASSTKSLTFAPKDGDEVVVQGRIGVYVQRGQYSIYVNSMDLFGQGQVFLEKEKLKRKLFAEGLFDESKKRAINQYPRRIGVITAANSAAIKDIIHNIHIRYPIAEIIFFPSLVQGDGAPQALLDAFNKAIKQNIDTLIIGRGGGANEDLNAFDDETLVRAVAKSPIPVISAVGHEIDNTILDLVADKTVSTPTAAATASCVDKVELYKRFNDFDDRMKNSINMILANMVDELDTAKINLSSSMKNFVYNLKIRLDGYDKHLTALNPTNVMSRGFVVLEDENGQIITSIDSVNLGQNIKTKTKDGIIESKVTKKEKNNGK